MSEAEQTEDRAPVVSRAPVRTLQLPASFQIPPGMVLVRSDGGQLMLVSQQALAQAQGVASKPATAQAQVPRLKVGVVCGLHGNCVLLLNSLLQPPSSGSPFQPTSRRAALPPRWCPLTISTVVPAGVKTISTVVPAGVKTISTVVPAGVTSSSPVVPAGVKTISTVVPTGVKTISTVVPAGVKTISTMVPAGVKTISTMVPAGVTSGSTVVPAGVKTISTVVPAGVKTISTVVPAGVKTISTVVPVGVKTISTVVPAGVKTISTVVPADVKTISTVVPTVVKSGSTVVTTMLKTSSSAVPNLQKVSSSTGPVVLKTLTTSAVPPINKTLGPAPRLLIANVPKIKATPPVTVTTETLENVKKCKSFLVTLMKLASSGGHSADMAKNVRALVKSLLEGNIQVEEFTDRLYSELRSSPQPYLVPFLKKSLPAVRQFTPNPQLFIQQCDQTPATPATPCKTSSLCGVIKPNVTSSSSSSCTTLPTQSCNASRSSSADKSGVSVIHTRSFKDSAGTSFRDDDDLNDVASMAGVSVSEERARILATGCETVGSVIRSCSEEPFLSSSNLQKRVLHMALPLGVISVCSEVVGLISDATQERLRDLLEKLTHTARHRLAQLKDDWRYRQTNHVRAQLRFLEQVERLQKQRREEEEKEELLRVAKIRSSREDPEHARLKQRAKEMQQLEAAAAQQRQADLTALAAIGPRRKRPLDGVAHEVCAGQRSAASVTRVTLRDLIFCMEHDHTLSHSLTLYRALL
ncbi:transcription initiation factor TFIID subunit 4B-like [Denticeps clupeoides]|uniref:transcription initiation factor TFIID subunit 4B-like n=1 Tax=Denticeps clupeoides TaxID=299321 RepID=UPI0010A4D23B|nr:transcription initiation factor TFIID subunit 4B-like [Denticeps clupeoides]